MGFPWESRILTSFLPSSVWSSPKGKDRTPAEDQGDDWLAHRLFTHLPSPCTNQLNGWVHQWKHKTKKKGMGGMQLNSLPITAASSIIPPSHNLQWWAVSIGPLQIPSRATQWLHCSVILPHCPKLKSDKLFPGIRTAKCFSKLQTFFSSVLKLLAQSFALHLSPVQRKMQ